MNGIRVVYGGSWYTATTDLLPRLAGYGKTEAEAIERLRLDIAAEVHLLANELERLRAAQQLWVQPAPVHS